VFWLAAGAVFALLGLLGAWPDADRPLPPESDAAREWALGPLVIAGLLIGLTWLATRERLLPRRPVADEERLAGATAALLAAGVLALVIVPLNAYALVFVLPSLHAWLWLPQVRHAPVWTRLAVVAAGFVGPALIVASFAFRYGLGLDTPWYLLTLVSVGYVEPASVAIALAWTAIAMQLLSVATGRYAPYPSAREHGRGPFRSAVARTAQLVRHRRARADTDERVADVG